MQLPQAYRSLPRPLSIPKPSYPSNSLDSNIYVFLTSGFVASSLSNPVEGHSPTTKENLFRRFVFHVSEYEFVTKSSYRNKWTCRELNAGLLGANEVSYHWTTGPILILALNGF